MAKYIENTYSKVSTVLMMSVVGKYKSNMKVPMPGIAEESTCHNPRTRRLYSRPLLSPPNFLIHSQRKVRVRAIFSRRVFFVFFFFPVFPRSRRVSALAAAIRAAACFYFSFGQLQVSGRGAGERDVERDVTVLRECSTKCFCLLVIGFDTDVPLSLPPSLPLLTLRTHPVNPTHTPC